MAGVARNFQVWSRIKGLKDWREFCNRNNSFEFGSIVFICHTLPCWYNVPSTLTNTITTREISAFSPVKYNEKLTLQTKKIFRHHSSNIWLHFVCVSLFLIGTNNLGETEQKLARTAALLNNLQGCRYLFHSIGKY